MRILVRPLAELSDRFGASALKDFNCGVNAAKISQTGIVVDHVLYLQPAYTRSGNHLYAEEMHYGAFSVSKTAGAAVALLRLARKYDDSVFDERIADYLQVTARHPGWDTVTFGETLSMATGIGDTYPYRSSSVTFADEGNDGNPHWWEFNHSSFMAGRLAGAFSFRNYPWVPGEVMRYNSAHTMILAVAMDNYLKSREGPDTDPWRMLNEEVYQPIGIRWLPSMRPRINSTIPGPEPLGWGLLPNAHDIVRIAALHQNEGKFETHQLLHRQRTLEMMRQTQGSALHTAEKTQLITGSWVDTEYRDGAWSAHLQSSGGCTKLASRMEWLGRSFVVMLPSSITLFRFADANVYDAGALIITGERLYSSCP